MSTALHKINVLNAEPASTSKINFTLYTSQKKTLYLKHKPIQYIVVIQLNMDIVIHSPELVTNQYKNCMMETKGTKKKKFKSSHSHITRCVDITSYILHLPINVANKIKNQFKFITTPNNNSNILLGI